MTSHKKLFLSALLTPAIFVGSAGTAVIASTNFDGRTLTTATLANDTATGLNWTVDGVADPGNMTVAREDNAAFPGLFNGNTLTQNSFAPAINVGNTNLGWRTSIALTVLPGSTVTLEDVTFIYSAINGAQSLQGAFNTRLSDFTITLFDPSATSVGSVFVDDTPGAPTAVSAVFSSPITLSAPGTYNLEILGDEAPETGNHIAIDNLSINGTVVVPEPSALVLSGLGLIAVFGRRRRPRS